MTLAITLATWLAIFGAYFAGAFGLAVLVGRFIALGDPDQEGRE